MYVWYMYTNIFKQIVEMFTDSLKEHLLLNLITKECSQWVPGQYVSEVAHVSKFYLLFCFFFTILLSVLHFISV